MIVLILYLFTCIMLFYLNISISKSNLLQDMYYWIFFGGIDDTAFDIYLSFIIIIFRTFFKIIINIFIAYLSNQYSGLEDSQVLENLKTKAKLKLEIEVLISFFR